MSDVMLEVGLVAARNIVENNEKEGTAHVTAICYCCFFSRRSFNGNRHSYIISVPQALTELRALSKHRKLQGPHYVRREHTAGPPDSTGVATFQTEKIFRHPCQSLPPRL
eukprot:4900646-Prymnesium_polylepis.1